MNSTENREFPAIEPLEIEPWLKPLKKEEQLQNPTFEKVSRVMSLTFQYGQRYGFVPRDDSGNPMNWVRQPTTRDYRAIIMTPKQRLLARTTSGFNSISHYRHAGQIRLNAAASGDLLILPRTVTRSDIERTTKWAAQMGRKRPRA